MLRSLIAAVFVLLVVGCATPSGPTRATDSDAMFGPTSMKIDPIFTKISDWTGDGKPDGIEVSIGFQDRFDDPTKAAGRLIFELYEYRREDPDARGKVLTDPWVGPIDTLAQQKAHWFPTGRTYTFQLAYNQIRYNRNYVLTAQFDRSAGGRFFDKIVLVGETPKETKRVQPSSLPGAAPGGRNPQP